MKEKVLERLLRYVKIDTTSDSSSTTCPSTEKQFDLARVLEAELKEIGLQDVSLDEHCYLMATLPANTEGVDPIGFIAHMDTNEDVSGTNVNPRIIENYDGKDIVLNEDLGIVTTVEDTPELKRFVGEEIIVTDGTTLLGGDDKAGIAAIMTAMEYLVNHPEIKHGEIKVGFTPDEEIGTGADKFDVEKFGAKYAYTLDGGAEGELNFETFSAALATVSIKGKNVHPGSAKNKMVNALYIAGKVMELFPEDERPETTEGYEGFYHLNELSGNVDGAKMIYLIRDHDKAKFEARKEFFAKQIAEITEKYDGRVSVEIHDQYYNMRDEIEPVMHIVDIATEAMKELDVEPNVIPIRGGTDGSKLSKMGLPCPNLFGGGINFHSKNELLVVSSMVKASQLVVKIAEKFATR